MRTPSLWGPWWIVRHVVPDVVQVAPDSRLHLTQYRAVLAARATRAYPASRSADARIVPTPTEQEQRT